MVEDIEPIEFLYRTNIQEHNQLLNKLNEVIGVYNQTIDKLNELIAQFNIMVDYVGEDEEIVSGTVPTKVTEME